MSAQNTKPGIQKPEVDVEANIYIANCIDRIFMAQIARRNAFQLSMDVAKAFTIAEKGGVDEAHRYLVKLLTFAEAGGYAS